MTSFSLFPLYSLLSTLYSYMLQIHPSALVDPAARLDDSVEVGPFCIIGPDVTLGPNCRLVSHVTLTGRTTIGAGNTFYQGVVVGEVPQDLKYHGEPSEVVMGDYNTIREYTTIHRGTEFGGGVTRLGNGNLIMGCVHVAHDSTIEDKCIIANGVGLAGHVVIQSGVVMGGSSLYHQFVTVGRGAIVAGGVRCKRDCPPFIILDNEPAEPRGINVRGLERQGYSPEEIKQVETVYRRLFVNRKGTPLRQVCEELLADATLTGPAQELVRFMHERLDLSVFRLLETRRRDESADRKAFYRP